MEAVEYQRMSAVEDTMWWYRAAHANMLALLARFAGRADAPSGPVLDAGCGTGGLLRRLTQAGHGIAAFGIDADETAAGMAAAKAAAPVAVASVNALPFADASFAAVFSVDVLYHRRADPVAAVAEAWRCLMPGGVLIVNVPAYEWMRSYHDEQVHGARRYTRARLLALLRQAGFSRVEASYWNSLLFPIMVAHRKLAPARKDRSDVGSFPGLVEHGFRMVMAMERVLMRAGVRFPFGGSVLAVAVK